MDLEFEELRVQMTSSLFKQETMMLVQSSSAEMGTPITADKTKQKQQSVVQKMLKCQKVT